VCQEKVESECIYISENICEFSADVIENLSHVTEQKTKSIAEIFESESRIKIYNICELEKS
jgi:hypothetical protein